MSRRLNQAFYSRRTLEIVPDLLGCLLFTKHDNGVITSGRIVELEAYLGEKDKAAHSYAGRRTNRVEPMYAAGGMSYVYFIYGMHYCFNVVTQNTGEPHAILIRALEPVSGKQTMQRLRAKGQQRIIRDGQLMSGPAKVCQAMGIDHRMNQLKLYESDVIWIEPDAKINHDQIIATARIGVNYAETWALKRLRFFIRGNGHVSQPR